MRALCGATIVGCSLSTIGRGLTPISRRQLRDFLPAAGRRITRCSRTPRCSRHSQCFWSCVRRRLILPFSERQRCYPDRIESDGHGKQRGYFTSETHPDDETRNAATSCEADDAAQPMWGLRVIVSHRISPPFRSGIGGLEKPIPLFSRLPRFDHQPSWQLPQASRATS